MVLLDKKFIIQDTKVHIKKLPLSQPLKAHAKTLNPLIENFKCRYSVTFKSCIETFNKEFQNIPSGSNEHIKLVR